MYDPKMSLAIFSKFKLKIQLTHQNVSCHIKHSNKNILSNAEFLQEQRTECTDFY